MTALDGCNAKVERAREHHRALMEDVLDWLRETPYALDQEFLADSSELVFRLRGEPPSPPLRWSTVIGDVVHNLRSALDHLAWQLVLLDGGQPTLQTQFPIYESEDAFRRNAERRLPGVTPERVSAVEALQPYRRSPDNPAEDHLAAIQLLSNTDKHRVLTTTVVQSEGSQFRFTLRRDVRGLWPESIAPTFGPMVAGAEVVRVKVEPEGPNPEMSVDMHLELNFAFDEPETVLHGETVLGALEEFMDVVAAAVTSFQPVFDGRG